MPNKRRIDSLPMPANPQKVHVFVVGLCRTGTTSLRVGFLQEFGYRGHGMKEALDDGQGGYWAEAIRLKYYPDDPANEGLKPYGPEEFRKLFAKYNVITDVPAVLFVDEIRQTWPDAKIVVTNRNRDSWKKSMDQTVLKSLRWPSWKPLSIIAGQRFLDVMNCGIASVSQIGGRGSIHNDQMMLDGFDRYHEVLRQKIPADQRLEYHVSEGWEPLCKFLGLDIPNNPFPHVNDSEEFIKTFGKLWWGLLAVATTKVMAIGAVGYGALSAYRYLSRT